MAEVDTCIVCTSTNYVLTIMTKTVTYHFCHSTLAYHSFPLDYILQILQVTSSFTDLLIQSSFSLDVSSDTNNVKLTLTDNIKRIP